MTLRVQYDIGDAPPLGRVPARMHAFTIRRERYGAPETAFAREVVPTPMPGPDEVLVYVMAAGLNRTMLWAASGRPVDVIAARRKAGAAEPFHVGGNDGAGIVYAVGRDVRGVEVGDHVVIGGAQWSADCPVVRAGTPLLSPTLRIWAYETNYGAYGQFARVQARQLHKKPDHLTWEQAAVYLLDASTAQRMLFAHPEHTPRPGDAVLVWGGAGGVGTFAIQLAARAGARVVAVVSDSAKAEHCLRMGAVGVVDRTRFSHWGPLPNPDDTAAYEAWLAGARAFGKAFWDVLGEKRNPRIVVEHPGADTLPTSLFVCDGAGMVVTCAATTGFLGSFDLRYLWMRQKRIQGSHLADDADTKTAHELVTAGLVQPALGSVYAFDDLPRAHADMAAGRLAPGKAAILVGAQAAGALAAVPHAHLAVPPA